MTKSLFITDFSYKFRIFEKINVILHNFSILTVLYIF